MSRNHQIARDYLSQAFLIDRRIQSKIQQMEALRDMSIRATAVLTGMPRSASPKRKDDFISNALDLENEIEDDLQSLFALKAEIVAVIRRVSPECQALLEERYLCFRSWEMISFDLSFDARHVRRLHSKALGEVDAILREAG